MSNRDLKNGARTGLRNEKKRFRLNSLLFGTGLMAIALISSGFSGIRIAGESEITRQEVPQENPYGFYKIPLYPAAEKYYRFHEIPLERELQFEKYFPFHA